VPLVLDGGVPEALFWVALAGWLLGEGALATRTTLSDPDARDPTVFLLTLALVSGLAAGIWVAAADAGELPAPRRLAPILGAAVFAAGLVLRVWAVRTLGRFFRYTVVVDDDHRVIDHGPYRVIRHPSYTGLLAAGLGVGIALDSWLSAAVCLLPPLVGFTIRLLSEERTLADELGEPYLAYMRRTRRLLPGIW
jgi:protein-S-isoprenylcysteine O-methyltransferase Ste14